MNKGLLKIALLSMVCASMPAAITSCKDYDDDIDNLQGQDKDLQAQITAIQAAVESLKSQAQEALANANNAAAAAKAAQDAAEAAAAEAKAAKEYATSAAANAKAEALAEIAEQLKGYTTKAEYDALQARVKALEEKLAQGGTTTPGTSYDEALQALQTQLDALNQYKALLENLAGKEAFLNGLDQTITEINSAIAGLQNQASNFDVLLQAISNKVAAIEGALVTINGDQLRSLVFNPVFYYHGIEAMWAPTFAYAQLDVKTVNADGNFATDAPVAGDSVYVTPNLVATYHMNPSTAQMPADVKAYSFTNTIKHVDFVRASNVPTPTIYEAKVNGGDVTVKANLKDGILPYIATDSKVTVLALEVSLGDTVITSDYAALKPLYTTGFELADARMADHQTHLHTTMAKAIADETPFATVAWNSEGVNIAEWVDTHYKLVADQAAKDQDTRWDINATKETVREKGFTYEYALVGYKLGENKTSESAHAALKVDGYNCIFRPQMTNEGLQQPFGSAQGMASIDRLPIVRVALKDTISGKYAAVGYMKIQIVPDTKEDEYTIIDPFTFDNAYTATCPLQSFGESLTWWQVEEKIIEKLGISKQEFEEQYTPDYTATKDQMTGEADTYLLKQFDKADKGAKEIAKEYWIGEVGKTEYDQASSETNVIKWNIGGEQAYNLFVDQKLPSTKVIVRFVKKYTVSMGSNHTQTVHHYVYVTLNWTPKALNVTPSGTISNGLKIAEMWYTAWTNQHGGFDETHLNVAVPKTANDKSDLCTFESHLLYPWKQEMKLAVSEIAEMYKGYGDEFLTKTFSFKPEQAVATATGVSGAEYVITVEGQTLYAALKSAPAVKQPIAVINNPTYSLKTWGTDDPTVEYQQTAFALDILNAYSHTQLAKGETPTGTIQITAVNECNKPIALTNNTFNVRFLRPINMDIKDGATMIDAQTKGSVVNFADYISFTDWRSDDPMSFFSTHPWYYTYYGLKSITVGTVDPKDPSNLVNGAVSAGSLKNVVTTTLGGGTLGTTTLAQVTPNMDIIFTPATGTLGNYNMGTLTYYNNGENFNKAFQIEVPLVLSYKWGYLTGKMVITVNPTPGQGN